MWEIDTVECLIERTRHRFWSLLEQHDTIERTGDRNRFRFIDTAEFVKLRMVESIGIRKTFEKIEQSQVVLYLFESLKFKVQSSEYIVEIEKTKINFR
jgi:tRNA U34 5-carboxymethylaminomethyl modifying GTPase MnmE/TrmE